MQPKASDHGTKTPEKRIFVDVPPNRKDLVRSCEVWFQTLPSSPDGDRLSANGAISAVLAAAEHYSRVVSKEFESPKTATINTRLKDLAQLAEKTAKCLSDANEYIRQINLRLNRLDEYARRRIRAVPSPILQIRNEPQQRTGGLLMRTYQKALESYGDAAMSELDLHVLRSELFLSLDSGSPKPYSWIAPEAEINKFISLGRVCQEASVLRADAKKAYLEFNLHPSYQLVEACMAILQAAQLPRGNSKVGLLLDLSTAIRVSSQGKDAKGLTKAIQDLRKRTKDKIDRLKPRLDYWVNRLLINDLRGVPTGDGPMMQRLAKLEIQGKRLHAELSRKVTPRLRKGVGTTKYIAEFEPWLDIDELSPFR